MHFCYVDEAGCPGMLPGPNSQVQPVLVIAGLFVPHDKLAKLTREFLVLKRQFNPGLAPAQSHWLDISLKEIKGADLRSSIRNGGRNRRRAVFRFLDKTLALLDECEAKCVSRIYIKKPGLNFKGQAVYTSSIQQICACFQSYLSHKGGQGMVIADSRTAALNSTVSHSIFTQKFKMNGDAYDKILEMPTFGHSENHVPIQITDFLTSSLLTPMATHIYCTGHVTSVHVRVEDKLIYDRYLSKMRALSYRYQEDGRSRGGITIVDAIAHRSPALLFAPTNSP
ncbi:MAG: DUF3800 domain-containing protein [Pseudomonadales bacterium]|uniref:DUF3800 domain-containing protein n=1 Tax=Stenotrophomonas sp. PA-6-5C TaxID=2665487 RepID=UPI001F462FAA|nr:DUF3800 domain-containing protein [Stenotrophomonas sp. PA-6-5C]MCF5088922.1 DUF3800 domain-containing protein [Stenotrophomonas sp. PA-6-5C]